VRPLRDAAARAAAALEEGHADERLTTSFVSSTDSDAGSGSTTDSDSVPHPRGHQFAAYAWRRFFTYSILPGFPVAEGSWQCRASAAGDSRSIPQGAQASSGDEGTGTVCLHFSYPDSIRIRALNF
jgi:hypothetical protein